MHYINDICAYVTTGTYASTNDRWVRPARPSVKN